MKVQAEREQSTQLPGKRLASLETAQCGGDMEKVALHPWTNFVKY